MRATEELLRTAHRCLTRRQDAPSVEIKSYADAALIVRLSPLWKEFVRHKKMCYELAAAGTLPLVDQKRLLQLADAVDNYQEGLLKQAGLLNPDTSDESEAA